MSDCCTQRENLRRLAIEAANKIERLREIAAGRDLMTVFEFRSTGDLIQRLRTEAEPCG